MEIRVLDARDLLCPMPVLKARKVLKEMIVGTVLEVYATDPAAARDFAAFCEATGHRLLAADTVDGVGIFRIEKTG